MTMASKTWISTNTYSKAYLLAAWNSRDKLQNYERRGFAQFFYITLCGNIESILVYIISRRLESIIQIIRKGRIPALRFQHNDEILDYSVDPIIDSTQQLASRLNDEIETSALSNLIKIYNNVFSQNLADVIGSDLNKDLVALQDLRNLFAHGRDIFMKFDTSPEAPLDGKGTLDRNPLQHPAERLKSADIIKDLNITMQNYNEFKKIIYSDNALLYFYSRTQDIEKKIYDSCTFLPELILEKPSLPNLND
jgi:hypothetical protein